jgi:hypothetical protein
MARASIDAAEEPHVVKQRIQHTAAEFSNFSDRFIESLN